MKGIYSDMRNATHNNIVRGRSLETLLRKTGADEWRQRGDGYDLYRNGAIFGVLKVMR